MKYATCGLLLLAACRADAPPDAQVPSPTASPSSPAPETTHCSSCRRRAGKAHVCSRTRWCVSCRRDAGTLHHRCAKTEFCEPCGRESGEGHVCGVTEVCSTRTCRREGTVLEAGPHHVCGMTRVCTRCRADAAFEGHSCGDRSRFCPRCQWEVTSAHACGVSFYCGHERCGTERLLDHDHGRKVRYCPTCRSEVPFTHRH